MKRLLLAALLVPGFSGAAFADEAADPLADALAAAKARHAAVFVDFSAVWCHSCYFMDEQVLTGPKWDAVKKRAVTVELDADSPVGTAAVQTYKISGFPTYVVLDEQGREVGRILGDRPAAEFYGLLEPILARSSTLEAWQAKVKDGGPESVAAGREALEALYERNDAKASLAWIASLPAPAREALAKDAPSRNLMARIDLLAAADRNDAAACLKAAPEVLGTIGCDNLSELENFQACLAKEPAAAQKDALASMKPRMQKLQDEVLVKGGGVCSDTRGVVQTAVELYEGLGDDAARTEVLKQGVAYSEKRIKGRYEKQRNLSDNLRFYRELQKDDAALDALYPKLMKAYPDDYVYAYRWGKSLAKRGKFKEALPLLEKAADRSFGRNRLWVATWRTYALLQLGRADEAKTRAGEALQANGPWFAKDAEELKAVAAGKAPA